MRFIKGRHKNIHFFYKCVHFFSNNMVEFQEITRESLYDILGPGDLLFFTSRHVIAFIIEKFCRTEWCHVGLVIVLGDGRKCLLESVFHYITMPDVFTNKWVKTGCRCVLLKDRLLLSEKVGLKKLIYKGNQKGDIEERKNSLLRFAMDNSYKPYERNLFHLLDAWYDTWKNLTCCVPCISDEFAQSEGNSRPLEDDNSCFFCTKLVAEALLECGLITRRFYISQNNSTYRPLSSSEYTVKDLYKLGPSLGTENYYYNISVIFTFNDIL